MRSLNITDKHKTLNYQGDCKFGEVLIKYLPHTEKTLLSIGFTGSGEFDSLPKESSRVMLLHFLQHTCRPKCTSHLIYFTYKINTNRSDSIEISFDTSITLFLKLPNSMQSIENNKQSS